MEYFPIPFLGSPPGLLTFFFPSANFCCPRFLMFLYLLLRIFVPLRIVLSCYGLYRFFRIYFFTSASKIFSFEIGKTELGFSSN